MKHYYEELLKILDDENDPDGMLRSMTKDILDEIEAAEDENLERLTYRMETQWDPVYIADLRGTYDSPELMDVPDDPYESMYY